MDYSIFVYNNAELMEKDLCFAALCAPALPASFTGPHGKADFTDGFTRCSRY